MNSNQPSPPTPGEPEYAPRGVMSARRLVLSPRESLIKGGAAEEFERQVQEVFREGYRHLVVDLRGVEHVDSRGIRALVRGYTTTQRRGGSFSLVGPNAHIRTLLRVTHLDTVFNVYDSLDAAQLHRWPWQSAAMVAGGAALCLGLVWAGLRWPAATPAIGAAERALQGSAEPHLFQPFLELVKLVVAALVGLMVTAVHRPSAGARPRSRSMEQAQVLLCVSGAMMMIIIGNSLARAFGIAGAASIIRFRTPVDDPKDVTILFLLMALGMASGLGAFAVAGLGAAFLCVFLLLLDRVDYRKPRSMTVDLTAEGREFPLALVEGVFLRHGVAFEPREVSQGERASIKYAVTLQPETALEDLNADLMGGGPAGVRSVSWEPAKKGT